MSNFVLLIFPVIWNQGQYPRFYPLKKWWEIKWSCCSLPTMSHAFSVQCLDYIQNIVWVWVFLTSYFANSLEKRRTSFFWTTAMVFVVFFYLQYPIPKTSILHMTVGCYFKKYKSNNFTFLLNSSKSCSWHLYNFKVFIFFSPALSPIILLFVLSFGIILAFAF